MPRKLLEKKTTEKIRICLVSIVNYEASAASGGSMLTSMHACLLAYLIAWLLLIIVTINYKKYTIKNLFSRNTENKINNKYIYIYILKFILI